MACEKLLRSVAVFSSLLALAPGGCADDSQSDPTILASQHILAFDCTPTTMAAGGGAVPTRPNMASRRLVIHYDTQSESVGLVFGSARTAGLKKVEGGRIPLYVNANYAWRMDGTGGYITDIGQALVFRCLRSGSGDGHAG